MFGRSVLRSPSSFKLLGSRRCRSKFCDEREITKRAESFKHQMVEQLVTRRGSSYEAIIEIRPRWGLEHVPAQLPPESEDVLLSPSMGGH
jgi:hypothetical protein